MPLIEAFGRGLLGRVRAHRQRRQQQLPCLRVGLPDAAIPPTVYYLCPDDDRPSGGNRTIYRHVDALNSVGIAAKALHYREGFAYSWFDHQTPAVGLGAVRLTAKDILVVPETYGPSLDRLPPGARVVIFNQGAYRTFRGIGPAGTGAPYRGVPGIEAILAVSRDSVEYLRYAFPELPVERVRNAVDSRIFHPAAVVPGRRVAMMPRQRTDADGTELLHLLRARGCLDGWTIVNIEGLSESRTAEAFRSCALFFSLAQREGFGMPPAEAMACGCYVVGYTGLGGREFFDPAYCCPVADGDILALAKAAERALRTTESEFEAMRTRGLIASARILDEYSLEHQRDDLVAFFAPLLSAPARK